MRSLFLFVLLFSHQSYCSEISSKALKLGSNANNYQTTTKDPFFDFGPDEEDQGTSTTTTEDPFFSFDDPFDSGSDSLGLPHCDTILDEVEQNPGINCDNSTVFEPEIRYNDQVFERLFAQVWSDFQYKLNNEAQLYGVVLDPFDVDAKLPQPIDIKQQGSGYNVGVKMHGIKMYGISGIKLDEVTVTRSENLTDLHVKVVFAFDHLEINGTYALKGVLGWWTLDSKGEQPFSIKMINATLAYEMHLDLVGAGNWNSLQCSNEDEFSQENVLITEIGIPLKYADVDFKFQNLGSFANTVVNGVGIYFLKSQEELLVGEIRKGIKKNVNSLIC